eukprot:CAMPEP_0178938572 /NCGR_PEP_ID=MMETSP0786-20121207/26407_1 /TAXON_ID=186022 /ORGANISM="Thalassionema frauenfeldii, Strain CCMP 1798" /LENGTH=244 /DNA_ID=CAMNT_0020617309 /DNA_START=178 /DNA_END=909 /DNA_ORIENTATION=-
MPKIQLSSYLILIATFASRCNTFNLSRWSNQRLRRTSLSESLDDLRRNLESSWNVDSMGQLPNNPAAAAEEAAAAIIQAKADGMGGLCFVELFLPQYDIAQGPNMYDEVEAIEFCMILTNCLTTQSVIYVKDQTSLNKVNRSLAKKRTEMLRRDNSLKAELYQTEEVEIVIDKDDELVTDGDDENKESNGRKEAASSMTESNVQSDFYDDFAELSSQGDMFFDPKATPDEAEEKKQTKITKKIV